MRTNGTLQVISTAVNYLDDLIVKCHENSYNAIFSILPDVIGPISQLVATFVPV